MIRSTPPRLEAGAEAPLDLTWSQRLLWTGAELHAGVPLYNMALAFEIEGVLDAELFDAAFQAVLNGCDAMRTSFVVVDGEPGRRVRTPFTYRSERLDWSHLDSAEVSKRLRARSGRSFDLAGVLFDSALIRTARGHLWFLNQHHLITDAWACSVVYRRVAEAYGKAREGSLPSEVTMPSYDTFASHERAIRGSDRYEAARRHWASRQARVQPAPLYGERATRETTLTERFTIGLGRERSEALRTLSRSPSARTPFEELSVFNVWMASLTAYLHRVSGESRISVGTPSHNRSSRELRQMAGVCIEVFPLTVELSEETTFAELLESVRGESMTFLRHAVPGTSTPSGNRSYNVVLNYIPADFPAFDGLETRTEWVHAGHGDRAHDLRLQVHDFSRTGEFVLHFDFSVERFDRHQRADAVGHFLSVLDGMLELVDQPVTAPALPVADPPNPEHDRNEGLDADPGPTMEHADEPSRILGRFLETVAQHGHRSAVVGDQSSWTYAELAERVDQVAGRLTRLGVRGRPVALATGRCPEAVVAVLGILRAGAFFVPLDRGDPDARLQLILQECDPAAIIVREGDAKPSGWRSLAEAIGRDGRIAETPGSHPASASPWLPRAADPAYVLYTSGSTGTPKGVQVSHRALAAYAEWATEFYVAGQARTFPLFTPLGFDLTLTSLFVPLLSGGTVRVYGGDEGVVDRGLTLLAGGAPVDVVKLTPAHLRALVGSDLRHLGVRVLIVGGEELTVSTANKALAVFGAGVRLYNEYGPTEATVGCTVHAYDPEVDRGGSVPIGRPLPYATVQVVDPHLRPVPRGVPGEIVIGGPGLADGYLNRPEETAARFPPAKLSSVQRLYRSGDRGRWTTDGSLQYLGRSDSQVKIHGVRVELGEVESALSEHPDVASAVVDLRSRGVTSEDPRWCTRCGLPAVYPGADLDAGDVCSICRGFETYKQRVADYFGTMEDLAAVFAESGRSGTGEFDCLLMLSGGKDSSYALYRLVEMGLRVTTVTLDNGFISDQAKDNVRRITSALGVPHRFAVSKVMNQVFAASLDRHANVCNGCFKTMYTLAFNMALEAGIPFVVTGLSRGQLFETRLTEELFQMPNADAATIDGLVLEARKAYHRADDPVNKLLDNHRLQNDEAYDRVRFVDFYRYCNVPLDDMYAFLESRAPWIRPADTGRSTNCLINEAGIWVHKAERGYHNYALPYSWDVRLGHKTRAAALAELDDQIDEDRVAEMLAKIGYPTPTLPGAGDDAWLTAYYTAENDLAAGELRAFLADRLPGHMIPNRWVRIDHIPRTRNGKLDRDALPRPGFERPNLGPAYRAPTSETEKRLAGLWASALDVDRVGVDDNFFDLGGDSITAIRIGAGALDHGLHLDPNALFKHQTVAELARWVTHAEAGEAVGDLNGSGASQRSVSSIDDAARSRVEELLRRADRTSE